MKIDYNLIDDGKLSKTESASLYCGEDLVGSLLIMYQSNGIKNMAYIERVRILDEYRGHENKYGSFLMDEVVQHIAESEFEFETESLEGRIASNSDNLSERLESASNRSINEIYLKCSDSLKSFYSSIGFTSTDSNIMKIKLNDLDYSSLE